MPTSVYNRVKNSNGACPNRPDEDFELAIVCLCKGHHEPIIFEPDKDGNPRGIVTGNLLCWWGLFEWIIKDIKNKDEKLIKNQWLA